MRTRRSENGPGLGSQNDESENEIRHSPLKKRIRKDLGQILPRRRVTRSRLAIVEIEGSESEGESIGDLAPYDNGSQRSVSYTRHRKLRSRSSPARSKSIPTRRSDRRRDQSEDNRPTRSPRRSLRSLRSTRQEDHEEDDEEEKDDHIKPKRKKRQFASEITSVLNTAEEHYGNLDMNISMVAKVKERARRRQELREQKERELEEAADDGEDEDEDEDDDDEEEEEEGDEVEEDNEKGYSLRRNRASTKRFGEVVVDEPRRVKVVKRQPVALFSRSGAHRSDRRSSIFSNEKKSRSHRRRKKMSTASSSSSSSSSDEEHFQKKKHRQMEKSRLSMLPMNLSEDQVNRRSGFRDRERIGASLADVDPMEFDKSINFKSVGGHPKAIKQLQEMVVLPLLYPDVFSKFKVSPPRGVLFYGPPGTGKTLMARALVNECSQDGKKVAFFMRKGSDVLSKWVGESERQLRLLFDQAFRMRPSVIFFDEIDGLAPVRSSRQDHIHSSIVSTLLALMDGLDSRGEVIIIGATNRIDSIDPALRRPGRFDREILFQLPGADARKEILKIHTKEWEDKLSDDFLNDFATKTNGYCGADLKALCTESVLNTLRRTYPSVYRTQKKIAIDTKTLKPNQIDFENSIKRIIPASVRSDNSASMPLSKSVEPLLNIQLAALLDRVNHIWPQIELKSSKLESKSQNTLKKIFDCDLDSTAAKNATYRPRLLITGPAENGQTQLARALLDNLDHMKTVQLTLPQIYSSSTRTTEDSLAEAIREASRHGNSILFIPEIISFWDGLTESSKSG